MAAPDVLNVYAAEPLATGGLWVAPLKTPKPADLTTPLAAPWVGLGFVGEDGVTKTQDRSIDKKKSWGGTTVKILQTDFVWTLTFVLLESTNPEVLKVVYGDDNVTVTDATAATGTLTEVLQNSKKLKKRTWCVDSIDSELGDEGRNAHVRLYIPIAQVMTVGDVKYVHTDTVEYSLEVEAFPDDAGNHTYESADNGVWAAL